VAAFFGWFRLGFTTALWRNSPARLLTALKEAVRQNIVPDFPKAQLAALTAALDRLTTAAALQPAAEGEPASLGDLLATMPTPLAPEKAVIAAEVLRDTGEADDDWRARLKANDFADAEIAAIQVTRALGTLAQGHAPLVRELQRLRGDETDGSLRF